MGPPFETVRPAETLDLPRCEELLAQACRAGALARGGVLLVKLGTFGGAGATSEGDVALNAAICRQTVANWHGGVVEGRRSILFVGAIDGVVVGLGAASTAAAAVMDGRGRSAVDRSAGRIECCFVEPAARGVGVGGGLVHALTTWLHGQGCSDVDVMSLPGDRATKRLFESAGFKTRLLVLHRSMS